MRSDKDLKLWKEWKAVPSDANLTALLKQMQPVIMKEVHRWSGVLPPKTLELEARALAVKAFHNYNPNAGTKLSTHVTNRLQKLSRMVYTHQDVARISEHKRLQFKTFNVAQTSLGDQLGRDPTQDELADELGWSPKKVKDFQKMFGRKEYTASEEHPTIVSEDYDYRVDFTYAELTPQQKELFDYVTGSHGKPKLSNNEIMKKMNMTQGQLSYNKRILVDKFSKARNV